MLKKIIVCFVIGVDQKMIGDYFHRVEILMKDVRKVRNVFYVKKDYVVVFEVTFNIDCGYPNQEVEDLLHCILGGFLK